MLYHDRVSGTATVGKSEARQRQDLKEVRAERKVDNQALAERLDRVLESSLAAKAEQ